MKDEDLYPGLLGQCSDFVFCFLFAVHENDGFDGTIFGIVESEGTRIVGRGSLNQFL